MPVGGETIIAGQYTVTYGGTPTGIFEGDAGVPTLEVTNHGEKVANTDAYGKTTIDAFYQGADWSMAMVCIEYRSGSLAMLWPFGGVTFPMGVIGRRFYDMSLAMVLTAIAGTPAAASPATMTATRAIMAPEFASRMPFGPTLRKFPVRMQLLPYMVGGVPGWFSQT